MISFFNRIGNTWFAKAIFVILAISMVAFWGLGGISNTTSADKTAIRVGSKKISLNALAQAFDTERAKLSQLTGQYISPAQAISFGLLDKTVQNQVAAAITEEIQNDLGLAASDAAVRKYVERHPAFQDTLGNFDRNLFLAYLTQTHVTEAQLAEQLRNELSNQHLSNTIRFVAPAPQLLAQMKWQKQNETRDIEALLIKQEDIPVSKQPTEEDLKDYYEAYISDFMQPETRDIAVLSLTPEQVAKSVEIPKEQLDAIYEEQKESYAIPEKRHIYQMRFKDEAKAVAAKKDLTAQNFMIKAMANGQTAEETDFGTVTRTELLPELAEVSFSGKAKTIVGPVESPMGWHLILIDSIQPAAHPNKTDIYADIKQKMAATMAYDKMEETARNLEDLLGEGKSLQEAAKQLHLETLQFKKVDIAGESLPKKLQNKELMQDVFTLKEKEATALVDHNNGFILAEVEQIYPTQPKSFAFVKDDLKKLWHSEQQKAALPTLVEQTLNQMKSGNIPAKSGQLIVLHKLTSKGDKQLPTAALPEIFMQSVGYENAQAISLGNGTLISVVKGVKQPVMQSSAEPEQKELLSGEISDAIYSSIIASYANELGVQINTNLIQEAFSVYQTEQ